MGAIDNLLRSNGEAEPLGDGTVPPAAPGLQLAVLTCMDARIQLFEALQLGHGQAHILRNGGGVVTDDVIRSLAISQRKLGTREVMVIQHTSCGMMTTTEDAFKDELERDTGLRPMWAVEAFADLESSVKQSVLRVKRSPFVPHTEAVRGFVYDVGTGRLSEVR